MDFYDTLNYGVGNEAWSVEAQALNVKQHDRVVCVTASGDRPLHLLMTDCAEVISIDMNRIQNYLLDLKMAALSQLDFEKYIAFLGCEPAANRYAIFTEIKSYLQPASALFWEKNKKLIQHGIIYQGRTEKFARLASKFIRLFRNKKVRALFEFDNIEEQRHHIAINWDTQLWHKLFEVILNPKFFKYILNDPGLNLFVEITNKPGVYIYRRMLRSLNNHLAKKNALLQLILIGKILPEAYFPYLTWDGYQKIRKNINKLSFKTMNIIEFLKNHPPSTIDCFSLSDIASYMPQSVFEQLLASIYHAAKPNARFCIREFMSNRYIPVSLNAYFRRDQYLEKHLEIEETNFVYRFMTGTIQK